MNRRPTRLRKDELHHVLWEAIDAWQSRIMVGLGVTDTAAGKSLMDHQRVWMRTYGKSFFAGLAGSLGLIFGGLAAVVRFDGSPVALAGFGAAVAATIGLGVWGYQVNKRTLVRDELITLLPSLELSPVAHAYARAVVAVVDHPMLSAEETQRTLAEIWRCVDEAVRLERDLGQIATPLAQASEAELAGQEADLRARWERATDATTRQTYEESIRLLETRRAAALARAPLRERGEAQLALIHQSLSVFAESLERHRDGRVPSGSVEVDLGELRTRLAEVRGTADGLERAIQELTATS